MRSTCIAYRALSLIDLRRLSGFVAYGVPRRKAGNCRSAATNVICRASQPTLENANVVSSIRLEKPHSLSYQAQILTRFPDTLVRPESNMEDAG